MKSRLYKAIKAAESLVGKNNVDGNCQPMTAAEDFAFMLEAKAGAYMCMGNGVSGSSAHSPTYVFNVDGIPFGIGFWIIN